MCTNRALVNGLECYMDDLIETFEDIVKKSLILITVGLGAIVFSLVYLLKLVTERTQLLTLQTPIPNLNAALNTAANTIQNRECPVKQNDDTQTSHYETNAQKCIKSRKIIMPNQCSTPRNSNPQLLSRPIVDETLARDIGLDNGSKITNRYRSTGAFRNYSDTNMSNSIPSIGIQKHLPASRSCVKCTIANRKSCCSMCCEGDDRR